MKNKKNHHRRKITPARIANGAWRVIRGVIIIGICFIILQPLFVKLSAAVMSESDLYDSSVKYIPKNFTLDNFKMAFEGMNLKVTMLRTALLSGGVAVLQLMSCLVTAYGFARFRFPGRKLLFGCVLFTMIVPPQIIMLPMFMFYRFFDPLGFASAVTGGSVNLIDTVWPYIIQAVTCTGFKNGLYIYMLRQFFKGMPRELDEAAFVDGCGKFRTFVQIMLPSAVPMMITVFLFGFVWQWTDNFYASLYLPTTKVMATSLGSLAATVYSQYESFGGSMNFISPGFASMMNNTGVIITVVPLILLYLICQRHFIEGIERSGIVG